MGKLTREQEAIIDDKMKQIREKGKGCDDSIDEKGNFLQYKNPFDNKKNDLEKACHEAYEAGLLWKGGNSTASDTLLDKAKDMARKYYSSHPNSVQVAIDELSKILESLK